MTETLQTKTPLDDVVKNGSDMSFMTDVIDASKDTPVVVDFWAPWCGPCRQLMPALEKSVRAQGGKVRLVKINIDENPGVAGQLGVQSIPAVFAFKGGQPVDGFMGAQPQSELDKFVARLSGESDPATEAAGLVARAKDSLAAGDVGGAAQDYAAALQLDAQNAEALAGLARIYLDSGNRDGAQQMIDQAGENIAAHPEIAAMRSKLALLDGAPDSQEQEQGADEDGQGEQAALTAKLADKVAASPDNLDARLELAKALAAGGDMQGAVDHLIYSIGKNRMYEDEAARKFLLTIFEAEGPESEVSKDGRRRLSSILFA